ncbi:MAG: hypothetical protein WBY44_00140, partial [Bryobacteraceae bacterium]
MDELFVLPGQSPEQQRRVRSLGGGKGLFLWALEMVDFALVKTGLLLEPGAFFGKAFLNNILDRSADLDEIWIDCRLRFKRLCAHSVDTPVRGYLGPFKPLKGMDIHRMAQMEGE